ncbi:MAG TPA: hypothetical protein VKQ30_04905 [Ktedonobacterales bacterium]|nr:hypothetical protein [Ktedonobacterales bacterium]
MEISDHEYARMVRWAEQQLQRVAALEEENRELRRQVEDLRRGVGMAVVVQGRVISVNPAPAEVPLPNAGPVSHPSFGPVFQTGPQPVPAQPPYQPPYQEPVQPTPRQEVFSEGLWITGQTHAVKAPAPAQRSTSPSQEMTPSWLREDVPQAPTAPPAPRRTLSAATSSHPAMPKPQPPAPPQPPRAAPSAPQPAGRQRVLARPLTPRLEATSLPSLAQLTGQQPAVRVPGRKRQQPDDHTPYSDSFVLG